MCEPNEFTKNICGFRTRSSSVVIYTKCNFAHPILCVTGSVGIFIIIKAYTASALHTWKRNVLLIQNAIFPISRFYSAAYRDGYAYVSVLNVDVISSTTVPTFSIAVQIQIQMAKKSKTVHALI